MGLDTLDPELLGNYKACGIGKWLYEGEGEKFRGVAVFPNLKKSTKRFHLLCRDIVIAHNSRDKERVKTLLAEREELSTKLLSLLENKRNLFKRA